MTKMRREEWAPVDGALLLLTLALLGLRVMYYSMGWIITQQVDSIINSVLPIFGMPV